MLEYKLLCFRAMCFTQLNEGSSFDALYNYGKLSFTAEGQTLNKLQKENGS